jgi:hypothetical protein
VTPQRMGITVQKLFIVWAARDKFVQRRVAAL